MSKNKAPDLEDKALESSGVNAFGKEFGQCRPHRLNDLAALDSDELAGLIVAFGVVLTNSPDVDGLSLF